ncbi:hypothetical protein AMST5_04227 [freshwater sediment metagenome]|uniref:Uncharacterized protein n=1 Tax=freshwater sediment metagenome TaxID=556182 RepID=A0AA48M7R8_9ZZZZ
MFERYPIHNLIETRRASLVIGRGELARRCGFRNISKGLRRIENVCNGDLVSPGAKGVIVSLPAALELEACEVEKAVKETGDIITRARAEEEAKREAAWRASFKPAAYLLGTQTKPSSITIYGFGGGAERWLRIPLDLSQPPVTYATQALTVVRRTPEVPFFGATVGFVVKYTPDRAVEFDTDGRPVASFEKAYRPGEVEIFIGKQKLPTDWLSSA